jgi:hypothetical protein
MTRRDAFSKLRNPTTEAAEDEEATERQGVHIPSQPLDLIPAAQPRKKRSRDWEKLHRSETVTYRGVPLEYHQLLGEIARSLCVPRDEVVRAFLEHSLNLYQEGQLTILAHPKAQRMTLFPEGEKSIMKKAARIQENREWLAQAFPSPRGKSSRNRRIAGDNQGSPNRWEARVTYRLPLQLKTEIKAIAVEHTLPVGEVVWFFIEQAIQDYRARKLVLEPTLKTAGKTIFRE